MTPAMSVNNAISAVWSALELPTANALNATPSLSSTIATASSTVLTVSTLLPVKIEPAVSASQGARSAQTMANSPVRIV